MTLNDYQKAAERTSGNLTSWDKVRNGCYGLNGEAGECIDILKKTEFQGHAFDPMKKSCVSAITWVLSPTSPSGTITPEPSASIRMCCGRTKPICWQAMLRGCEVCIFQRFLSISMA